MPAEHNRGDTINYITTILCSWQYDLDHATKVNTITTTTNFLHYTFLLATKLVV
jgi:hypothetical protein